MGEKAEKYSQSQESGSKTIKEIRIIGLQHADLEMVKRELLSKKGQPYEARNRSEDEERLDRLNIFSDIQFESFEENDGIILEVRLKETFRHLPIPAIEVSEENNPSFGGGYRTPNLFGKAVNLSVKAMFGGSTVVGGEVMNPWFSSGKNHYRFKSEYRDRYNQVDDYQEKSLDLVFEIGRQLSNSLRIGGRGGVLSISSDQDGITISDDNRDNLLNAAFFVGYDTRDLWSNPSRGWWNEFEIARWGDNGKGAGYWSFIFDARRYQPLVDRHTIALFSLTTLRTGESNVDVPIHQDFLIGGVNTVRGWSLSSRRGINQFLNTAEYRYTLMKPRPIGYKSVNFRIGLQVAGFVDWGFAWDKSQEFRVDNSIAGYGFGLRLLIPYAEMIRLEFAYGEKGNGLQFYFGINEKAVSQRNRIR